MEEQSTAIAIRAQPECPALKMEPAEFLKAYSPVKVMKLYKTVNTPVLAATAQDVPTLVSIKQKYGEDYISGYLAIFIVSLEEFLGCTMMSDGQLEETVLLLMEDNYYLNLADLNNIMNSVKKGQVKLSKVNGVTLSELFADYRTRRFNEMAESRKAAEESIAKHGADKTHQEGLSLEDISEQYLEAKMAAAERDAKRELMEINLNYKLSEVKARFKHAAAWHNETKDDNE